MRGDVHTNSVEGYFSIFKRGMRGIYQHCGEKHLHRYLAEYHHRYNYRVALGFSDIDRTLAAIKGVGRQAPDISATSRSRYSVLRHSVFCAGASNGGGGGHLDKHGVTLLTYNFKEARPMAEKRGLVISCPAEISGGALTVKSTALDPQELRFSLLFWDKLDYPMNNMLHVGLLPEGQFLQEAGVLQRTEVRFSSVRGGDFYRAAHVGAFRELDRKEPGTWSLATGINSVSFEADDVDEGRGVLVSLHRAIPVPDKDVPLADILEFRTKRRDELITLRHHLEDIYQRVISAGDGELSLSGEKERLKAAVSDHIKSSREFGMKFRLVDFDASLNVPAGVAAAAIAYAAGLPLPEALLPGGAAALTVKAGPSLKRRDVNKTPFKYVSSFHKELF